jgi:hypothetical protein
LRPNASIRSCQSRVVSSGTAYAKVPGQAPVVIIKKEFGGADVVLVALAGFSQLLTFEDQTLGVGLVLLGDHSNPQFCTRQQAD